MRGNHERLAPGALLTVEPGRYAGGEIGLRIEDEMPAPEGGAGSPISSERSMTVARRA